MADIDSRQAGLLTPLSATNTEDPTDTMREWVAGLTGLALDHVRRRWVPKPGTRPGIAEDWCAVGYTTVQTYTSPESIERRGDLEKPESGDVIRVSHQSFDFTASFYGSSAALLADTFRESAQVSQNLRWLRSHGLSLQAIDESGTHAPDFLNEQWVDRIDLNFRIGRRISRVYGIRSIAAIGDVQIRTDSHTQP